VDTIGVGIIGASPGTTSWAEVAHIPAIAALPDYTLRAVSTSRRASADAAAAAFGAPGYDDHRELIARPDVDLVVVAVKVPQHHRLIADALTAGKMVYSEWPLGRDLAEAEDLAQRATSAGVRTVIGLQARFSPVIVHARQLVADGYVGEVLSATLVGSGSAWGGHTDRAHKYLYDVDNGATVLASPVLHALDAVATVLGELTDLTAQLLVGRSEVEVVDEGIVQPVTAPDQVGLTATLANGGLLTASFRGGVFRGGNLHWEIHGTHGDLVISADGANGNIQVADLHLAGGRDDDVTLAPLPVPGLAGPDGIGANVHRLYAQLATDIRQGTTSVPGFAHALDRHRLIDTIQTAAQRTIATHPAHAA
jgi:predicted dehydrogenase